MWRSLPGTGARPRRRYNTYTAVRFARRGSNQSRRIMQRGCGTGCQRIPRSHSHIGEQRRRRQFHRQRGGAGSPSSGSGVYSGSQGPSMNRGTAPLSCGKELSHSPAAVSARMRATHERLMITSDAISTALTRHDEHDELPLPLPLPMSASKLPAPSSASSCFVGESAGRTARLLGSATRAEGAGDLFLLRADERGVSCGSSWLRLQWQWLLLRLLRLLLLLSAAAACRELRRCPHGRVGRSIRRRPGGRAARLRRRSAPRAASRSGCYGWLASPFIILGQLRRPFCVSVQQAFI